MPGPRTQEQIAARLIEIASSGGDLFGFSSEVLLERLDFEHARPWLKPETTAADWPAEQVDVETAALEYLEFAIGKIRDHRGISASRSVDKLREYAWLLGRDDVVDAMDGADYAQYGAPKVRAFATGMGWPWPDDAELARMANGDPCTDDCDSGCGW